MGAVRGGRLPRARYTGSTFWICEECFRRLDEQTEIYEPVALLPLELLTQKKEHCYSSRGVTLDSCPDGRSATERFWMRKGTFGWGSVCFVLFLLARDVAVTGTPRTGM